jgi:hypothetical protein
MGSVNLGRGDHLARGLPVARLTADAGRKLRAAFLAASALGCSIAIFTGASPAAAANDCGAVAKNFTPGVDQVACNATSGAGNPYTNGISYDENATGLPVNDLTVVLAGGPPASAVALDSAYAGVSVTGALNHNATAKAYAGASIAVSSLNDLHNPNHIGIYVTTSGTGSARVINQGAGIGGGGYAHVAGGIVAIADAGAAYVNNSGVVQAGGAQGAPTTVGIRAYSNSQAKIRNSAPVTVNAYQNSFGLQAGPSTSGAGPVVSITTSADISATAQAHYAYGATGIQIGNASQFNLVPNAYVGVTNNANVTATGFNATGVAVLVAGDITISAGGSGVITANRMGASYVVGNAAVYAFTPDGNASVSVNSAVATGAYTEGVHAHAYFNVSVTANSVSTTGAVSPGVDAYGGTANVSVGKVTTAGATSPGVLVDGDTNVNVSAVDVVTQGANSPGLWVITGPRVTGPDFGAISVSATSVYTHGDSSAGVRVVTPNDGSATISVGSIVGNNVYGVTTMGANSPGVVVDLTGIHTNTLQVTNNGFIQTYGANSPGVQASSQLGSVTVASVTGTDVTTRGDNSKGLSAYAKYGQASVTNAGVVITGAGGGSGKASIGLYAGTNTAAAAPSAANTATIHNTGAVTTYGAGAHGAYAKSTGAAYIQAGTIVTHGAGAYGALAKSTDATATIVSTSVTTSGVGSLGLEAWGQTGATITTGAVTINGAGVVGSSGAAEHAVSAYAVQGAATVHITGAISATGANMIGVYAGTASPPKPNTALIYGSGPVTVTGGATTRNVHAVLAESNDNTVVDLTGPVTATGVGVGGVAAVTYNGPATVTVGNVTAYATAVGAYANFQGSTSITVNGAVVSTNGVGIYSDTNNETGGGSVSITVAHGASVSGPVGAIYTGAYQRITIVNHGAISGTVSARDYFNGHGTVVLNNYADGVISGSLMLKGGQSTTFANYGVWNAANSQIGMAAVSGLVTNGGVVNVAPGATAAATVSVTNVGTWINGGPISMRNGHTGDVFNLGSAAFVASGASTLNVDVSLTGATKSDELVVGAVSGTTVINVKDLAAALPGAFDPVGATVVQGTSGQASNFTLAGGMIKKGFADYVLQFNPTNVTWSLVGLLNFAGFGGAKYGALAQGFANRSNEPWYARTQEIRDVRAPGVRDVGWAVWAQVYGGDQSLNSIQTFVFAPVTYTENLSTTSQWSGIQFGADHLSDWKGGKLLFGFTAGMLDQWTQFASGPNSVAWANGRMVDPAGPRNTLRLNGLNVGAYGGWSGGGWFANALVKADFANAEIGLNSVPLHASTQVTVWSLRGEFGYRYGGQRFFLEPVVRFGGGDASIDAWSGAGATGTYPEATDFEVAPGARIGGQVATGPIVWTPHVGAYWYDQPLLRNRFAFSAGDTLNLQDQAQKSFARIEFGATAKAARGLEGFLTGSVDTGSGVDGWTVDAGIRWRW